jgi:hypothetical protein
MNEGIKTGLDKNRYGAKSGANGCIKLVVNWEMKDSTQYRVQF